MPFLIFYTGLIMFLGAFARACFGWRRAHVRANEAEARRAVAEAAHSDLCRAVFAGQPSATDSRVRFVPLSPQLIVDAYASGALPRFKLADESRR